MKSLKSFLFAALILGAGLACAADRTVRIIKVAGTVQLMKNGVVVMTIKPGDAIPMDLKPNISLFVISGTIEVEAGGMKISGVTGSEFTPVFSRGALMVSSEGRASVAVKNPSGLSVVMTSSSEVKINTSGDIVKVEVQKGRAVVFDPSGGGTKVVKAGETASFPAVPSATGQKTADEPMAETKSAP